MIRLVFITLLLNTPIFSFALSDYLPNGMEIPGCPQGSQKFYSPNANRPLWIGCKNSKGLFNGFLFQLTYQGELTRVAVVKDSIREGKEIRFGLPGFLEERSYRDGHLEGDSFVFKSDLVLHRTLPKEMKSKDWLVFLDPKGPSILSLWAKLQPFSVVTFQNGRIERIRFDAKDYRFKPTPDGRMMALNHSEMKSLFFIDPGAFLNLGSDDLRRAILPGFGSCKKYSGPIGRFGRHYDSLLYNRVANEKKHNEELEEIRNRFLKFCVPEDIRERLGMLECPPQLPDMLAPGRCLLPISDQLRIPYHPKYFKYEYMGGLDPESFLRFLGLEALRVFSTDASREWMHKFLPPKSLVIVKKKGNRLIFRVYPDRKSKPNPLASDLEETQWWEWKTLPGYE